MDNELVKALEDQGMKFLTPEEINQAPEAAEGAEGDGNQAAEATEAAATEGNQPADSAASTDADNAQAQSDPAEDNRVVYTQQEEGAAAAPAGGASEEPSQEEVQQFVNSYLQESLGMTLEDIRSAKAPEIDESIKPILDFVQKTGRSPEEWFIFQQMDPSKMDDVAVLKMDLMKEYPDLNPEDVQLMIENKYKIGDEMIEDRERKLLDLQIKMDSKKARQSISEMRDGYIVPKKEQASSQQTQQIVNDKWLQEAAEEIESLEGIDFEIGEKTFTFGLSNSSKERLKSKSAQIDGYLDQYKTADGRFNHEIFNVHQAVIGNIGEIVKSVYNQGISDGQRNVVNQSANVDASNPRQGSGSPSVSPLEEQISRVIGESSKMMTVKF